MGVYYTLEHVAGRRATVTDLTHALAKLRRSDVIRWLGAIAARISDPGGMELETQLQMAESLLSDDLRAGLHAHIRQDQGRVGCVFHRRQLWFVLQMAVLACMEDTIELTEDVMGKSIGECCLMASDILTQIEPRDGPGPGPEAVNRWMATVLVPILDSKDRHEILGRAQAFWFDLPALPAVRKIFERAGVGDFACAFFEKYGVSLREFFLILFTLNIGFQAHSLGSKNPLLLDEATYLGLLDKDQVAKVLAVFSQTPDQLALKLLSTPRQNWSVDFTPLRESPVVQVFPGKYACPDQGLLQRCMTDGMYFLLQKAYPETVFGQIFGHVFEAYTHQTIREFTYEGTALERTFYASPKFLGTPNEAGDGILHWDGTAVVMEYKARLLTTRERYGGSQKAMLDGIDDIIAKDKHRGKKGVHQLAGNLGRMLAGQRVVSGVGEPLNLSGCQYLFPAVVVYEESLGLEAIRQEADVKLRAALKKLSVDPARVGPLLLLTIGDIESLDALAKHRAAKGVIHDYVTYVQNNPKDRAGSFRSFLINHGYIKDVVVAHSLSGRLHQKAMNEFGAEIAKRYGQEPPSDEKIEAND